MIRRGGETPAMRDRLERQCSASRLVQGFGPAHQDAVKAVDCSDVWEYLPPPRLTAMRSGACNFVKHDLSRDTRAEVQHGRSHF